MSSKVTALPRSAESELRPVDAEIVIGKDLLELLAGAMYADPLTIFREYVQNAADSVEERRAEGWRVSGQPDVVISLDVAERRILIRDYGVGVPKREFVRRLTSIGASPKRGLGVRGFRGVGRLSGLGYCQELFFRGRAKGEDKVTELRWDVRKLRELLRDGSCAKDLSDVVRSVAETRQVVGADLPEAFFEVELRRVSRLRNDVLLDAEAVRSYLSQVAPVPFRADFSYGSEVREFLRVHGVQEPIDIRINGDAVPVYHRAQDEIKFNDKCRDTVKTVRFFEFAGQDGDAAAFGWTLEHAYLGSIPRNLGLGGIRLRAKDIQVGGEGILSSLFSEPRFAAWAIGDVHVCSPKIVPNARRDDFEASFEYSHLQDELALVARNLSHTIRSQSLSRRHMRRAMSECAIADEWLKCVKARRLPQVLSIQIGEIVHARIDSARKQLTRLPPNTSEFDVLTKRVDALHRAVGRLATRGAARKGRPSLQDRTIQVALGVVLDNAASPHAGLTMSKRILRAFERA